jgi:uncharacterized protein
MRPLKALLLSDGRPGHFRLAEGVLAAVERRRDVAVERLECRRGRWPGAVLGTASNLGALDQALLKSVYGLTPPASGDFDLVVSAGAETLAANVAMARLTGAANIFYGSLRLFRPESFSLVLTSYARNAGRPRHAMVLKPSGIRWPADRPPAVSPARPPAVAALLLGGDAGSTTFAGEDWQRLLAFIAATCAAHGTRWIVANSRRTPAAVSDRLMDETAVADSSIKLFIDVRDPAAASLAAAFAEAEAVVCTDDSSSMVSEAISAGLPTIGARPVLHTLPLDEAGYRAYLTDQQWLRALDIAALSPDAFLAALAEIKPLRRDPLEQLGDLIAACVPGLYTDVALATLVRD